MLLRFTVANYLSILDSQELSLVASRLKAPEDALRFEVAGVSVLPSAVIYGPNASGKSNIIAALSFMRSAILHSHTRGNPEGGVPRRPFALDASATERPSILEADFLIDGIRYQFGFEANNERFTKEWLYSFPEGKRRKLYDRTDQNVSFGPSMRGPKRLLSELMRPNSLFLSTATQNDHEQLSEIRKFFSNIKIIRSISVGGHTINDALSNSEIDQRTIKFLGRVGTGITGYRKNSEEISDSTRAMMHDLTALIKRHVADNAGDVDIEIKNRGDKNVTVELAHQTEAGELCYLELDSESAGTRRLILLLNDVFQAIDSGDLVVIDEVDASLHTFASEAILALFDDHEINRNGAQLIATVHDTNLLTSTYLSRDQIWLTEKNDRGETEIFALAEIRSRPSDNFELGYLQGRYGGTIAPPSRRSFKSEISAPANSDQGSEL
ncbi:MAG: hypothetical protein CFE36_14500 [Sphingomonadaceae bacterium PASS1]|nr:MAG: hypothetical protein CFE36_14500 [Sphingomonadaceae bacterium PASS1]